MRIGCARGSRRGPFRGLTAELAARGIKTNRRTVWFFLRAQGMSFKKAVLSAEQPYRDIAFKRARWKTLTVIAALQHDRIDAPWVINGPINGALFATYVEQELAPTLAPGDIVIFDNLGSHKARHPGRRSLFDLPAGL